MNTGELSKSVASDRAAGLGEAGRHFVLRPTLIERVLLAVPLPYLVTSAIYVVLLSPPGLLGLKVLVTGDWAGSLRSFFMEAYVPQQIWQQVVALALWTAWPFFMLWQIRRIRMQIGELEASLSPVLSQSRESFVAAFRAISRTWPPILASMGLILSQAPGLIATFARSPSAVALAIDIVRVIGIYLLFGCIFWVYISGLRGVHQLGSQTLKLKPVTEDPSMGVTSMGKLSLLLASAYFANLAVMVLIAAISPVSPAFLITLAVLIAIGAAFFFLPLHSLHEQMSREKQRWQSDITRELIELAASPGRPKPRNVTLSESDGLPWSAAYQRATILDIAARQINAIPTWPVDVSILTRLAGAMALPVLVALITRFLMIVLGW